MTHGTVKVKLRPIKLAFLVNPEDKESLLKAIEINTFLWGGIYNPIIPIHNPTATKWKNLLSKDLYDKETVSGYLDNFDPDCVVPMGECSNYPFDVGDREKVEEIPQIFVFGAGFTMPEWGIGLFEVLNRFIEEEFKFQARFPQDVCIPDFDKNFSLFLSSVFGVLREDVDKFFWTNFTQVLNAKKTCCSTANYVEFLDPQKLFFTRMTELYLETNKYRKKCILLLDASNSLDIMDYWNLRAIGWDVFPIPYQFIQSGETSQHILDFAKENYLSKGPEYEIYGRTNIYDRVPILKSRSIRKSKHRHFLDSLKESNTGSQISYPSIWNREARDKYDLECCELVAETVEHEISTNQKTIEFKTLDPKSAYPFGMGNIPRFVNEIEFRFHDNKELFANAIPRGGSELAKVIYGGAFGGTVSHPFNSCRLSKGRLVYPSRSPKSTINLLIPQAETIFTKWLELRGWTVELSSAGRIAKQMIRQLGGVSGTEILAKRGIIELLGKINSKGGDQKSVLEEFVWSELQRISSQTEPGKVREAESIRQRLIETKAIQLGMAIRCPICTQSSWYSVEHANYELQCPKCLEQFSFPPASKEVKWSYRALGTFSLPNQAHGAYTVLLTLHFFSHFSSSRGVTTPFMSFKAEKEGMPSMEADLALLFQDPEYQGLKTELIFAECKTFNTFQEKDRDRMIDLGKEFPGAVLVFATLNESLSDEEKCLLRSVVDHFHKDRKNNHPLNPVLILTSTELVSESHFFQNWKEKEDRRAEIARISTPINLLELCDLTQHIYLDMDLSDPELLNKLSIRSKSQIRRF